MRRFFGFFALVIGVAGWLSATPDLAHAHRDLLQRIYQTSERIESEPDDPQLFLLRGILYSQHREWERALADLDRAAAVDPTLAEIRFERAKALLGAGCTDQALVEIEAYLERQPNDTRGWLVRARVLMKLARYAEAADEFDYVLTRLHDPRPRHYLARMRAVLEADPEAVDRALFGLDQGLDELGQIPSLVLRAIALERRAGRADRAVVRVDRLIDSAPTNPRWLLLRGKLLEEADRPSEARQTYRRALDWIDALPEYRRESRATVELRARLSRRIEELTVGD